MAGTKIRQTRRDESVKRRLPGPPQVRRRQRWRHFRFDVFRASQDGSLGVGVRRFWVTLVVDVAEDAVAATLNPERELPRDVVGVVVLSKSFSVVQRRRPLPLLLQLTVLGLRKKWLDSNWWLSSRYGRTSLRLPLTNLRAVSALLDLTGRSAILGAQFLKKKFGLQIRQLVPDCAILNLQLPRQSS